MKKSTIVRVSLCLSVLIAFTLLTGCRSTSTIYEYDSDGVLTKKTETTESPIKSITEDLKNKTVIIADRGWAAKLKAEMTSSESAMPNVYIGAAKLDHLYMSVLPEHMKYVPATLAEWRQDLVLNAGILSVGEKSQATKSTESTTSTLSTKTTPNPKPQETTDASIESKEQKPERE